VKRALVIARLALCAAATSVSFAGCGHVAPYQRAKLAHASMVGEFSSPGAAHMTAIHEGAVGGGGAAEAGCGCN
jgi:hypothetical protein